MPRKKRKRTALSTITKKVASRKKRNNPDEGSGVVGALAETVLPGVVAFGLTKASGRVAYRLARKRSPKLAKHVGAITPSVVAGLTWFASTKVESLDRYSDSAIVGSAIAAVAALAQTYIPQLSWMVFNDYHLDDVLPQQAAQQQAQTAAGGVSTMHAPARRESGFGNAATAEAANIPELESFEGWGAATDDASLDALEEAAGY